MLGVILFLLSLLLFFSPYRFVSIFLVFVMVTGGFQLIPTKYIVMSSIGINKTYDWVLLLEFAILLFKPKLFLNSSVYKSFKFLTLYAVTLLMLLLYSVFIQNIEASVSIRVFRGLIYFTAIFLFIQLSKEEIAKLFRLIVVITTITSLIYCSQLLLHTTLLSNVYTDNIGGDTFIDRYYNLPVYIYPVIFFLVFVKDMFTTINRSLFLIINSIAIVLSQHRNLLLALTICYFIHYLITNRFSLSKLFLYSMICISIILITDNLWNNRFSKGLEELSKTSLTATPAYFYEVDLTELTTTEFRKLLLEERFDRISKNTKETFLGLGMLTEDSKKAASLNFNIGMSDGYGNVTQVDSSDIAWSSLLLQLGILGITTLILFHLSLLRDFFITRQDQIMQVGISYLICLFITSFFSNTIILPYTTTLIMLFAAYFYHITTMETYNSELHD